MPDRLPDRDLLEVNKKLVDAWALLTVDSEGFERMGTAAMAARKLIMPQPEPEPDYLRHGRESSAVIIVAMMPAAVVAVAAVVAITGAVAGPLIDNAAGKDSGQN